MPMGIDDISEEESPAFVLWDATQELAANQRMQLSVLVDRTINPN